MTTTEQRSGFRLPWVSDARPGAPADDETPPAADGEEVTDPEPTGATPSSPPAAAPVASAPARPRRDNPLVTGLVRAMRDATGAAREETAARFAEEAKARVETIHAQSADEATEMRRQSDAEIVEIREWSKAEMARIREETDQRIADRRRRLESEVEAHAARVARRIERVQATISEFEHRMDAFFEELLAEEDPARLAGLAEQLPEPPSLDAVDLDDPVPAFPTEALDAHGAAAAEAEALAGLDANDTQDAGADPPAATDGADDAGDADVVRRLAAFTGPATTLPEAAVSRLAVVGLVSVASIAGFKRALAKTHGVRSVSVASGPNGDFVFAVSHDPDTDLRSAVPTLEGFAALVTGDADGVIAVTATDPESAH